ncbi:M23 family metallopeptidase [Bdellovibrio sp. 22V]|uniref:M23 family metallopeptidase n=1 Tax=Bdellovibrio TaxID=958 RepID=UPI00254323F8|nr:M23 family metallopeptidase [Bdellovibrio sp. 22V]WII73721.1 M23 family metallopeptidase [Bdellovibrio sp. 22V]
MKRWIPKALSALVLSSLAAPAAMAFDEINDTLYLTNSSSVQLYLPTVRTDGRQVLKPALELPEESILSIDVLDANRAFTHSQTSPERLKFPYLPAGSRDIKTNLEFICGLTIVDAMDEDVREDEIADRTDFCAPLHSLSTMSALESNGDAVIQSYDSFRLAGDLTHINTLSNHVERLRQEKTWDLVEKISVRGQVISPIQNCGRGCLVATSEFGMRRHPVLRKRRLHKGIDLRAKTGTPIVSVLDGRVIATRSERNRLTKKLKGYGHYVIVVHPKSKMQTVYAHLSEFKTKAGTNVVQGSLIALSGNTGIGTAPHLHFETHTSAKRGYTPVNPRTIIGSLLDTVAAFIKAFSLNV